MDTTEPAAATADAALTEVIRHYFLSAAEEMRATLVRTAFSPVIYEVRDFGISIYDSRLDLVAEATGLTRFLGANDYAVRKVMEYVGVANLRPGDIVLSNYPYWNAAHVSDATLTAPVFDPDSDKPFAYLCVRAHWADLGAKDPGYVIDSTDMHQEGLVFPGTHVFRAGAAVREIHELLRYNSRMPDIVLGDLDAQVASIRTGTRRLKGILAKFDAATVDAALRRLLDHGEATARAALATLPEGSWAAEDILDDDGISDDPITMKVRVTHRAGKFEIDFAGSPPCVPGPVNLPFGSTLATCKVAFKALTTPEVASNGGHMRPLFVHADPGTLFNASYPAPTFTQWTGIVLLELIFKALAPVLPHRLAASSGGDVPGFMMIGQHPDTGATYAISNNDAVGWGATAAHDGADTRNHPCQSIVRNTPIEVMETRTPMFFERVEMVPGSGGPGQYRGGLGLRRDIRFLASGEFLTVMKKTKSRPWSLVGAGQPASTRTILFPGTDRERKVGTARTRVEAGDRVRIMTAGGGGYGDPTARDPALIEQDRIDGLAASVPEGG
ncbi:MAG: hydantoinase B/oxoprolinase family protein [Alphaproteobacteria bacterium]